MIRRVALLFTITGLGQVFTILGLKYLASAEQWSSVAQIGEIETLIQTLVYVIGFGIQTEAIRTTAFAVDWKAKLGEAQVARVTLSLLLVPFVLLVYFDWTYSVMIIAPALALSCDYALYARGLPVAAALVAFLRAFVPLFSAIVVAFMGVPHIPETFMLASLLTYLGTNWIISSRLNIPNWWKPSIGSLRMFVKTLPIGLINLGLFFFGLGILFFARFLVVAEELAVAYMALKFYSIFKGSIRVVQQGFINKMKLPVVCLRVDEIAIMIALGILCSVTIFPKSFVGLFFGAELVEASSLFVLLGVSALIFSLFSSVYTRALLENHDMDLMWILGSSVAASLVLLTVLPIGMHDAHRVLLSVVAGETILAIGVGWRFMSLTEVRHRVLFLLKCAPTFLIPVGIQYFFPESVITYGISLILMGIVLLLLNYRALVHGGSENIPA